MPTALACPLRALARQDQQRPFNQARRLLPRNLLHGSVHLAILRPEHEDPRSRRTHPRPQNGRRRDDQQVLLPVPLQPRKDSQEELFRRSAQTQAETEGNERARRPALDQVETSSHPCHKGLLGKESKRGLFLGRNPRFLNARYGEAQLPAGSKDNQLLD